jgi:hypothetical protein
MKVKNKIAELHVCFISKKTSEPVGHGATVIHNFSCKIISEDARLHCKKIPPIFKKKFHM